jgi:methionine-rich copper-binding protein CopC
MNKMRNLYKIILILGALSAFSATSSAHAFLDHADPKVGATVATPPAQIKAWFTQHLEPAFSTMQVLDGDGKQVDKNDAHVDSNDASLLVVSLPPLAAGTYTVKWRVVSVDTHRTHGTFQFTVQPKS